MRASDTDASDARDDDAALRQAAARDPILRILLRMKRLKTKEELFKQTFKKGLLIYAASNNTFDVDVVDWISLAFRWLKYMYVAFMMKSARRSQPDFSTAQAKTATTEGKTKEVLQMCYIYRQLTLIDVKEVGESFPTW